MKRITRIAITFIAVIAGILAFEWILYRFIGADSQIQLFDKPQLMAVLAITSVYIALWPVAIFAIIYAIICRKLLAAKTVAKSLVGISFSIWTMFYALCVIFEIQTTALIEIRSDFPLWIFILSSIFMISSLFVWGELFPENFTKIGESISLEAVIPPAGTVGPENIEIEIVIPNGKTAGEK